MVIRIEPNPNCSPDGEWVFNSESDSRIVRAIRATLPAGGEEECDIVGVEPGPRWAKAHVQKIADSGEGTAYLIYGGPWGIRIRPKSFAAEPWDIKNPRQWGEPYKVYGREDDILFGP